MQMETLTVDIRIAATACDGDVERNQPLIPSAAHATHLYTRIYWSVLPHVLIILFGAQASPAQETQPFLSS